MAGGNFAVAAIVLVLAIVFVTRALRIVPHQHAWIVERLGKYDQTLGPGLNFVIPFVDRVAYKHSLKEIPLDVPSQVCITKDNTQLTVDGVLYFQVTDPMRASYGSSNYISAITQLAQTTLRSVIGRLELDKTFEERDFINSSVVASLDEAALNWGVKVLRYEIKDIQPPKSVLEAMEKQMRAEREKRAEIAKSEGERQSTINRAEGDRSEAIARSEGEKMRRINEAEGQAQEILKVAEATAEGIRRVAEALSSPGGQDAANLDVAKKYLDQFGKLAKENNTMIVPANLADVSSMVATVMSTLEHTRKIEKQIAQSPT